MALPETEFSAWQDERVEWSSVCPAPPQAPISPPLLPSTPPSRLPLGQTWEQVLPSPSASPCPLPALPPLAGSQMEEEAWLPGRVGLPGRPNRGVTPPVPETLQTLDLSGTSGNSATQRVLACQGTESCVWDASEVSGWRLAVGERKSLV